MYRFSNTLLLLAFMVGAPLVSGCGEKNDLPDITAETTDPALLFDAGVKMLKSPDKEGNLDYASAYDAFNRSAVNNGGAKAHYNAGWVAEKIGQTADAEEHFRAAVAADANYKTAAFALASMLAGNGAADEAAAIYRGYVDNNPGDIEVINSLAEALIDAGRYDESIETARTVLLIDHQDVATYRNLSRAYFAKGELQMSQLCAEKAKTLKDGDPGIYNNMGLTFLKQGDEAAAIEEFKTAIRVAPTTPEANLNLGFVALNSGDFGLALSTFEPVAKNDPANVDAHIGLAVAQRGIKDLEGAEKTYDHLFDLVPASNRTVYFNAAKLQAYYIKDYKAAQKILDEFIDKNQGSLSPSDEVFPLKDEIDAFQDAEDQRKKEDDERKQREKELRELQKKQLEDLKGRLTQFNGKIEQASCPDVIAMDMLGDFQMIAEQAQMVIETEEIDMAGDMMTMLDQFEPMVNELIPFCGGSAAPPTDGGDEAPEEGGDEAPAEGAEAPAEGDEAEGDPAPAEESGRERTGGDEAPAEGGE